MKALDMVALQRMVAPGLQAKSRTVVTLPAPLPPDTNGHANGFTLKFDGKQVIESTCNLVIDEGRGMAWQEDRSRPIRYDAAYYARYFDRRSTAIAIRINAAREALVRRHLPPGTAIIDVGVGSGEFLDTLDAHGMTGYGYDINPVAQAMLSARGRFANPAAPPTDVAGWTFWDSIEHLTAPDEFLWHVRAGHCLFVALPTVRDWSTLKDWRHYRPHEHLFYWTTEGFADWLNAQGFEILEVNEEETAAGRLDITSFAARKLDLCFTVPSGIGDTSWVYSKIVDIAADRLVGIRVSADVKHRRAGPFVDLLPGVINLGYSRNHYPTTHKYGVHPAVNLSTLPPGEHALVVNPTLEDGGRIETCWPRQRAEYHYELATTPEHVSAAEALLAPLAGRPILGLYCHANGLPPRLRAWDAAQWVEFLAAVVPLVPDAGLAFLGAGYDDKTIDVFHEAVKRGWRAVDGVGKLHIGATLETIRRLHYFFAYPSGLGILADVLDTPCMMWYWPGQHDHFIDTYADPANVASGRHINRLFGPVAESFAGFERGGLPFITGANPPPAVKHPYTMLCLKYLVDVPEGAVIEFGVAAGWNHFPLADAYPTRKFYALDTWQGLQDVGEYDNGLRPGEWGPADLGCSFDAFRLQAARRRNVRIIKGDIRGTLAAGEMLRVRPSFAWLDADLYEPTLVAYRYCAERMTSGAVLGFHDWGNPRTPGVDRVIAGVDRKLFEVAGEYPEAASIFFRRKSNA